jgi:hypothetical protein
VIWDVVSYSIEAAGFIATLFPFKFTVPLRQAMSCPQTVRRPLSLGRTLHELYEVFGPELVSTQRDIAEADAFNVTWTGSSILIVTLLKKDHSVSV